ncbi:MAG: hypothetical protein AAGA44_09720 [Pseudomonadota bacterium]
MNSLTDQFRVEYDNAVRSAFRFLVDEFGYVASRTTFAERRDHSTTTTFRSGSRRIEFRQCLDSRWFTDLLFFPEDMGHINSPDGSIVYVDYRRFSIHRALEKLGQPALPFESDTIEALTRLYGKACRESLTGLVTGDFSLFGESVYVVEQVEKRRASERMLRGVFSCRDDAMRFSQEALDSFPEFVDVRMEVSVRELDYGD